MKTKWKRFGLLTLSSIILCSAIVPLSCGLIACTHASDTNQSSTPSIANSRIPIDEIQNQANQIDSVPKAIAFANQTLSKYYSFEMFQKDFNHIVTKMLGPSALNEPKVTIDNNGTYASWNQDTLIEIKTNPDNSVTYTYQRDFISKNLICDFYDKSYPYELGTIKQEYKFNVIPVLVKETKTSDVFLRLSILFYMPSGNVVELFYLDENHYQFETINETSNEHEELEQDQIYHVDVLPWTLIQPEQLNIKFPLLKNHDYIKPVSPDFNESSHDQTTSHNQGIDNEIQN